MRYQTKNRINIDVVILRSLQVKDDGTVGLPIYDFLLEFNIKH